MTGDENRYSTIVWDGRGHGARDMNQHQPYQRPAFIQRGGCGVYSKFSCVGSWLRQVGSSLRHAGAFVVPHMLSVAVHGLLSSCDMQAPEHMGSAAAVCGLSSCSEQVQ